MQILLNGLISGLAIALLAVAFQIVYLPTRVFFVGLAGVYALVPYVYLTTQGSFGLWPLSIAISVIVMVGLTVSIEWANHAPLTRKRASEGAHLISSLGIYIVVVQIVAMIWGNDTQTLRVGLDTIFSVGDSILTQSQLILFIVACFLFVGFLIMLRVTDVGLRLRALADNPIQFALYGYNIDRHRLLAFALAGIFVTSASLLTADDIGFDPYTGLHAVLLAVVAVIIGGRSSFIGPIVGGLLLGIIRAQVVWHLSARWQEAVTFMILALFLLLRPQGLFGRKTRIDAN
uniref:Branched-chain amino acid transport system permease protein n=1 Tax=Candidatus Kentrum eta TaxID=2126337 RepID=A0A450UA14_9GAMM|nr:MAG: branched-chain amino acid transport system permease protein [Candidatus Kentron sp. H]VFJ88890.1 MAG: branched-chain amino acid transport system permease protein [Candidatus Kentron sp. H]VFJ95128.1 MAG: branched-chain amino acid transport system permease protein [Candidatus Kentron sp. H]